MITVEFHTMNCTNLTLEEHNFSWDRWENLKFCHEKNKAPLDLCFLRAFTAWVKSVHVPQTESSCTIHFYTSKLPRVCSFSVAKWRILQSKLLCSVLKLFPVSSTVPLGISMFMFKKWAKALKFKIILDTFNLCLNRKSLKQSKPNIFNDCLQDIIHSDAFWFSVTVYHFYASAVE